MTQEQLRKSYYHFHDFYSNTYPRYEAYTSKERENDLYCMMKAISENDNRKLVQEIYYTPQGDINPVFKQNVLSASIDVVSAFVSATVKDTVMSVLIGPEAVDVLSAPVVYITGDSISSGTLSSQMEYGVADVIPTDRVGDLVAKEACDRTTIQLIDGNN